MVVGFFSNIYEQENNKSDTSVRPSHKTLEKVEQTLNLNSIELHWIGLNISIETVY